jgi:hypothetical protein
MNFQQLRHALYQNGQRIYFLLEDLPMEQARWKPDDHSWSILEVVNHLLDEEREDFRVRLDITINKPDQTWPAIDPERWVLEREYNSREFETSLKAFMAERQASLDWLDTLVEPDWDTVYHAPFGPIRAGDLFASWVAHDLLHMRQLIELSRAQSLQAAEPYQTKYAGPW